MSYHKTKRGSYIPVAGKCNRTTVVEYRSSYELTFAMMLDQADLVTRWEYELNWVKYEFGFNKTTGKKIKRSYSVDFTVWLKNGTKFLIEIKPHSFYLKAMKLKENDMNYMKWESAKIFAQSNGYQFKVITEPGIAILAKAWGVTNLKG